MIIYSKQDKNILARVSGTQDFDIYCNQFPKEEKNRLNYIYLDEAPEDCRNYKVCGEKLVKMSDEEIFEIKTYNRLLNDEERLLENLKPSYEEVQKAKNAIEILTLLQEVM